MACCKVSCVMVQLLRKNEQFLLAGVADVEVDQFVCDESCSMRLEKSLLADQWWFYPSPA